EATFTDYQRGRMWQDSNIVSRFYRSKSGAVVAIPEDRFFGVVVKAEKSKLAREVICRSVNAGLKAWFWDQCEKLVDSMLDEGTVDKIVGQFSTRGVALEQLETLLGKPRRSGWTKEDRKSLLGVWNALKSGETTLDEVFGAAPKPAAPSTG